MNNIAEWQENNNCYLSKSLAWLRLRLARLAKTTHPEQPADQMHGYQPPERLRRQKVSAEDPAPTAAMLSEDDIAEAARAMTEAADFEPPPAMAILGQRLGLSSFEQNILLLCAAMEFDTRIPRLCAQAQGEPGRPYPTFALAMALFDDPAWDALSADRPLRYWRLIEINQPGATPLTQSALRADERIVNYIKGLNQLDDRLAMLLTPFDLAGEELDDLATSHHAVAEAMESALMAGTAANRPPVIQLTGMDTASKQQVALHVFSRMGLQGLRLPAQLLPSAVGELENVARLWQRESLLLPLALYVDTQEMEDSDKPAEGQLQFNRFVSRCGTLMVLDTREPRLGLGPDAPSFEVARPTPAEQAATWKAALGEDGGEIPDRLAGQFNLNLPTIRRIATTVLAEKDEHGSATPFAGSYLGGLPLPHPSPARPARPAHRLQGHLAGPGAARGTTQSPARNRRASSAASPGL